jgi:hypothetical protein
LAVCGWRADAEELVEQQTYEQKKCVLCHIDAEAEETVGNRADNKTEYCQMAALR